MEKVPGKIIKLDEAVINRIAAGEVIQRPANALKELMENSLDAGARNIIVVVKQGGMKLLQIQDDGSGIREEDLPIVCERFTTSKLRKFEDLQTIGTYGFRGEALASISHVAHLSIITKTEDAICAIKAEYTDGLLKQYPKDSGVQNPKKCAGKQGTTILIEDLFYNMDTRRRAMKNATDEHNRIADVITRYAIHNYTVGFSFKKFGETTMEIRTPPHSTILDNIKILYGATISREIVSVSSSDVSTKCKMSGYVSNVNFSTKKLLFTLFINNRLVDSTGLRKSIESIYSNYLPKGSHPFVYLGIEIDPRNVDVNVHPTKHEVHFLHEDAIISHVTGVIENVLLGTNESRTFLVQSLLPGATAGSSADAAVNRKRKDVLNDSVMTLNNSKTSKSGYDPKNMVRTDPRAQKLDRFGFLASTPNPDLSNLKSFRDSPSKLQITGDSIALKMDSFSEPLINPNDENNSRTSNRPMTSTSATGTNNGPKREVRLKSVKNMQEAINNNSHEGLLDTFRNHTFVGCVDRNLALFQYETTLYACNIFRISSELFYQKLVRDFMNFGRIIIEDPLTLKELATIALERNAAEWLDDVEAADTVAVAEEVYKSLMSKRKMLDDYFSLTFDSQGRVTGIPMLLNNYFPDMEGLDSYIMNLARRVDWTHEQRCFETFCHQTALFYAVPPGNDQKNVELTLNGHSWKWTIEHILFPELQKAFLPPKVFAEDITIVKLTSLPALYKVFERC